MKDLSDLPTVRAALCDFNGRLRGKRMPGEQAAKIDTGGLRLPLALATLDIMGADIEGSPLIEEDGDGMAKPTGRGPVPMPWLADETALIPVTLCTDDGAPYPVDPRNALAAILDRYADKGLTVIAALELEFYLVRRTENGIAPPLRSDCVEVDGTEILSLDDLDNFESFFTDVYAACRDMDLHPLTAISEAGPGQFEINLNHCDAMRAADDALLFKTMIRGMARKHGLYATFLAKPYPEHSGSGAHVHFSVLDQDGNNIFDDGGPEGTDALRAAIAGCVEGLKELSLLLTPHGVSFDRLVEGAYAPTGLCWGYENRSVALRIPGGSPKARRIEHRVAGADVCPYLMLTGILGAALEGMDQNMTPPPPISGSAFDADLPMIPSNWDAAISAFESSSLARQIFDPVLHDAIVRTKRQEQRITENLDQTQKILMYLERV